MNNKFWILSFIGLFLMIGNTNFNTTYAQGMPPDGAEVRDLSDWIELHSSTITIDGQEVIIRRYRDSETTAMITAWPGEFSGITEWIWRIENAWYTHSYSRDFGTTGLNRMVRDDLEIPLCGAVDDIADVTGSGQSRVWYSHPWNQWTNYHFVNSQRGTEPESASGIVGYETASSISGVNERIGETFILGQDDDLNQNGTIDNNEAKVGINVQISNTGKEVEWIFSSPGARVDAWNIHITDLIDVLENPTEVYAAGDVLYFTLKDIETGLSVDGVYRGRALVDEGLGTQNLDSHANLTLFPNPVIDSFNIQYGNRNISQDELIGVFNSTGQIVAKDFEIGHLAGGVYYVVIQPKETKEKVTLKFIKK